jgi:hypothetical protein
MARFISDLAGTALAYLKLGFAGVRLKNGSGNLLVRNTDDSADAEVTASKVNISGNDVVLNSDAAGSGADWLYTLRRPSSGMTDAVVLTLPPDDGSPDQVLATDGSGNLTFVSAASTAACAKFDETTLNFGDSSPVAMFTKPANAVSFRCLIYVKTAFNGTAPTLSIGVSGTTSKFVATTEVDLKSVGVYEIDMSDVDAVGSTEAVIATYSADSSSAGQALIRYEYAVPT